MISCNIKTNIFINPPSAKPLDSTFKIRILDQDQDGVMADFDPDSYPNWDAVNETMNSYSASAIEVNQFEITNENDHTGEEGPYIVEFDVDEG